jgi:heavy metal sensor kinase
MSIRWRLTLWYGGALAVVVAAFGAAVYFTARHQLLHRIDEGLEEELADVLFEVERAQSDAGLSEWLQRRFGRHEGFDFQITRAGGERFFANQRLAGTALPLPRAGQLSESSSYRSASAEGGRWRIVAVAARGPTGELTVQVARPLEELDHETGELLLALLLAGPLALLVAGGGGYFLARRALAPVELLRLRTQEITADRLDRRLPVGNPADELGLLAATINDMIARLERSFAEVRRFTADASHELRTPLAVIRSEAEVALGRPDVQPEHQALLGSILEECDRLARLTDQLLALAREDAGMAQGAQALDLAALATGVAETMRPLAEARGVRLHAGSAGPAWVRGDELRLRQVFYNLLDNALAHTPPGGEVEVRVESAGGRAVATVRDTGEGIPAEHLGRVFDRFYRVDKARTRERGGSGLGLSIARSIVIAHGGSIELDSVVARGTTARVVLPAIALADCGPQTEKEEAMKRKGLALGGVAVLAVLGAWVGAALTADRQAGVDAGKVGMAAGTKATTTKDGVVRIGWPRTDVKVKVDGMPLAPFAGLGSWAAFTPAKHGGMVMGDTVVFQDEVSPAMDAAFEHGLEVTALHNHFFFDEPKVYFMHIGGMGDPEKLAAGIKAVWDAIKKVRAERPEPATSFPGKPPAAGKVGAAAIEKILHHKSETQGGVVKVTIGREGSMHGVKVGGSMGLTTWAAFSGSDEHAAVDGDFIMTAAEVQPVLRALRKGGIHVVALHNHMTGEQPAFYFTHFWGKGPAADLARGIASALEAQAKAGKGH